MIEDACRLDKQQREAVEGQIAETCGHRGWLLHAVNCRSNHDHAVVSAANIHPKRIRVALKAWATRCLKEGFDANRKNWWAERGSIRYANDEESLEAAIIYVKDGQDRKLETVRSVVIPR